MSVDWHRLRAVVLESDDWGLCAWAPDERAARALADTPVWRTPAGRRYGRSTIENAADVEALSALLAGVRGADGEPAVLQANTVMAAPDYDAIAARGFDHGELPLVGFPALPSRWQRPGLQAAVRSAIARGTWWPELHGLHHLPVTAWLGALRRGDADARLAFEHQSFVCEGVQASGEYDPSEPEAQRAWNVRSAVGRFVHTFGRLPGSLCPPDYRWDEALEREAEALGVTTIQGHGEREGRFAPRLRRAVDRLWFPNVHGRRFYLPPRIAFEPRGTSSPAGPSGLEQALRGVHAAWERRQPAILSTHRANYAHLDEAWTGAGRAALATLLARLAADGATFVTDLEVRALAQGGWSWRPVGDDGLVVRSFAAVRRPFELPAPAGVTSVAIDRAVLLGTPARGGEPEVRLEQSSVAALLGPGTYRLTWGRA